MSLLGDMESVPLVFTVRGAQADTKLVVFNKEFHVHSSVLKQHSAFFFQSMDSVDQYLILAHKEVFRYEYTTKADAEGSWSLVATAGPTNPEDNLPTFKESIPEQENAFEKLLFAIYSRTYKIDDANQLSTMTQLAECYGSLPILSHSLTSALMASPSMTSCIPANAVLLLPLAQKLRHAVLYKECMIHIVGRWTITLISLITDTKLKKAAELARNSLSTMIAAAHVELVTRIRTNENASSQKRGDLRIAPDLGDFLKTRSSVLPAMYRYFLNGVSADNYKGASLSTTPNVQHLMENKLVLNTEAARGVAGVGAWENCFLSLSIDDEDLPWDVNEVDF